MQITIFGASGRVGRLVVTKALNEGYKVVAFTHSGKFKAKDNLEVINGDIRRAADVNKAISGSDIVISTLGSWGTPTKDILSEGMKQIIPAMNGAKLKRIISLTGSDAHTSSDNPPTINKISHRFLSIISKKILGDAELHIKLLEQSDLDWTILRAPIMNERGNPLNFKLTEKVLYPWTTINRSSVAQALINLIKDGNYHLKAPCITRS